MQQPQKYPLTVGSVFTGIGGIDLGLEQTGYFITTWQVEINPWRRTTLEKNWPDIPHYEDIRHLSKHNLQKVDVLCGGPPCQDISFAGEMEGIYGQRSSLWFEYWRLIRELQPRYVIVENVAALRYLSKKAGKEQPAPIATILGNLAQSRYDAEWVSLYAYQFGLPHNRERVFIVAHPDSQRWTTQLFNNPPLCHTQDNPQRGTSELDTRGYCLERFEQSVRQSAVCASTDGFPRRVDCVRQIEALGNSVVPAAAKWVGEQIITREQREAKQAKGSADGGGQYQEI